MVAIDPPKIKTYKVYGRGWEQIIKACSLKTDYEAELSFYDMNNEVNGVFHEWSYVIEVPG